MTEREKLMESVCESIQTDNCVAHCNNPHCGVVQTIVENLIANGVRIPVRCIDCKNFNVFRLECHNRYMNGFIGMYGFCSYGERKD